MIVLASKSASRRTMLGAAGVEFEVRPAAIDERALEAELGSAGPGEVALALAEAKALSVDGGEASAEVGGEDVVAQQSLEFAAAGVSGERINANADASAVLELIWLGGAVVEQAGVGEGAANTKPSGAGDRVEAVATPELHVAAGGNLERRLGPPVVRVQVSGATGER